MDEPAYAADEPPEVRAERDPVAVAVGNASLLGVGYLLMGRRGLFFAAGTVTVALVWTAVSVAETWCEAVLLLWWLLVVAHGWLLARGGLKRRRLGQQEPAPLAQLHPAPPGPQGPARLGQWLRALAVTVPVLLVVGLLRFDAHAIEDRVTEARESGDCVGVVTAQEDVWFGHRLVGAPQAARGDVAVEACGRLDEARAELSAGLLDADVEALGAGYAMLSALLKEPGNDKTVETVLDDFLGGLPTDDACETVRITDWLRARKPGNDVLDRSSATADRTAPAALLGCGDDLLGEQQWTQARSRYRQLLDEHPDDARTKQARSGLRKVTLGIQLDHVRELVHDTKSNATGGYCAAPAKYSGAPAYRKGSNPALFVGDDEYTEKLPDRWEAQIPEDAALIVCVGTASFGTAVETCPYRDSDSGGPTRNVTFHKIRVPVKAYELRTGKLVADRSVQIGGTSCPYFLTYYGVAPSAEYVEPSASDVRNAFSSIVNR
ncbi:tetratricopeptide repeat protein [Streptomyces sp. NPDC000851]